MMQTKKMGWLKRHSFLIVTSAITILFILMMGYGLLTSHASMRYLEQLPHVNDGYMIGWRLILYTLIAVFLKPIVSLFLDKDVVKNNPLGLSGITKKAIILIVLYELLIVQNVVGYLLRVLF
jgi:hypothetical protein